MQRFNSRDSVLAIAGISGLVFLPSVSWAQCAPDGTALNDTIVCVATDNDGVDAMAGDDTVSVAPMATVTNDNGQGTGRTNVISLGTGTDSLTNDGIITASDDNLRAVRDPDGNLTVINNAEISTTGATDSATLRLSGSGNSVTNSMGATISTTGTNSDAIEFVENAADDMNSVTNGGTIQAGASDAISVQNGNLTVTNNDGGSIFAVGTDGDTAGVDADASTGVITVNNSGTISGTDFSIVTGSGDDIINNNAGGILSRDVVTNAGADEVTNAGNIQNSVRTGPGTDTVINQMGGLISGDVFTGADGDSIENSGTIDGNIFAGEGDNMVTNNAGATIGMDIVTGAGMDTVTNAGSVSDVETGAGDDTVVNSGSIGDDVDTGAGNDSFTLESGGTLGAAVMGGDASFTLGADNDTFINNSITANSVIGLTLNLGDGDDTLTNNGTLSAGTVVDFGAGNATVNNSGSLATMLNTGAGNDQITNLAGGTISGVINSGGGMDTFTNQSGATTSGQINLGDGDDNLINMGTLGGQVSLGGGNDILTAAGGSTINANVSGDAGTDSVALTAGGAEGTINGMLSGFEQLNKGGNGAFNINNSANVGLANVNGGILRLNGSSFTANTNIQSGAELETANSQITGNVINNGVLDSNLGQLPISGNYTQGAGGQLQLNVSVANDSTDLRATGTASLDGEVVVDFSDPQNLGFGNNDFALVTANGGRTGEFAVETIDPDINGGGFNSSVVYTANQAVLRVNRASQLGGLQGMNDVQQSTASGLDGGTGSGSSNNAFNQAVSDISNLDDASQRAALQSAGLGHQFALPEISRYMTRFQQNLLFQRQKAVTDSANVASRGLLDQPLFAAVGPAADVAVYDQAGYASDNASVMGLWVSGYGQILEQDETDQGFLEYEADIYGLSIGHDWPVGENGHFGVSGGVSEADTDFDDFGDEGDISSYFASAYGGWSHNNLHLTSSVSYARHEYELERQIVIGANRSEATSRHDADELAARIEASYDIIADGNRWLAPFVGVEYSYLDEEEFTESGAGALNQSVDERETSALRSDLGIKAGQRWQMANQSIFSLWGSLAWSHDYDIDDEGDRAITARFTGAPNSGFGLNGPEAQDDGGKVGLGISYGQRDNFVVGLEGIGEFREDFQTYGGQLTFRKLVY